MSRVKNSVATRRRRKKVLEMASGAYSRRSTSYKHAKETVKRGGVYAFRDRRVNKRFYRTLWIARINAGARANGLTYNEFMHGVKLAGIAIDRKVLADLAANDAPGFAAIVGRARASLAQAS